MKCEIISIGSELTSGQNLDTNSQWLSRRLAEMGIPVGWHTTVADDLDDNAAAFRLAARRAGLVLITGGLGPTQDDLTREALARAAGVELVLHQPSLEQIEQMFVRRNRAMPERNRVQALFPAGGDAERLRVGVEVVGDGGVPADGDADLGEAAAEPLAVGVEVAAAGQLAADGDDFRFHERRVPPARVPGPSAAAYIGYQPRPGPGRGVT